MRSAAIRLHDEQTATLLLQTMKYESREVRDDVLRSGFEEGTEKSNERLDAVFARS